MWTWPERWLMSWLLLSLEGRVTGNLWVLFCSDPLLCGAGKTLPLQEVWTWKGFPMAWEARDTVGGRPRTFGFALQKADPPPPISPTKSQAGFRMLPSKATQGFTTPLPLGLNLRLPLSFQPPKTRSPAGLPSALSPNLSACHPHPVSQSSSGHPSGSCPEPPLPGRSSLAPS